MSTLGNVLVTGGAGFIGSHLVDRIAPKSPRGLIVVDNLFLGSHGNLDNARQVYPALEFYHQDASDYEAMKRIVVDHRVDVIFDLAVVPLPTSLELPRWTVDTNVTITTVACELLREGHYQTLVHFSSSEVYGTAEYVPMDETHPCNPSTPYAASKVAGDQVVLAYRNTYGVDAAIVRPFNNFGPRQNEGNYAGIIPTVIRRALNGDPIEIFGDGEQTRDFVYVGDVADAALRAYEEPATRGRVLNIASGEELSINRLVRTIVEILEVDVPVNYRADRPGDVRRHCGSTELARRLIDFEPRVSLRDGLVETVDWYRGRIPALEARHGG